MFLAALVGKTGAGGQLCVDRMQEGVGEGRELGPLACLLSASRELSRRKLMCDPDDVNERVGAEAATPCP